MTSPQQAGPAGRKDPTTMVPSEIKNDAAAIAAIDDQDHELQGLADLAGQIDFSFRTTSDDPAVKAAYDALNTTVRQAVRECLRTAAIAIAGNYSTIGALRAPQAPVPPASAEPIAPLPTKEAVQQAILEILASTTDAKEELAQEPPPVSAGKSKNPRVISAREGGVAAVEDARAGVARGILAISAEELSRIAQALPPVVPGA